MQNDILLAVRQAIVALLPHGQPTLRQVATAVGLSVRTLQRQLAAAGLRHSDLVAEVRFAQACARLHTPADLATDTSQFRRLDCGQDEWREQGEEAGFKDCAVSASMEEKCDSLPGSSR